jgi:hypothetical protein
MKQKRFLIALISLLFIVAPSCKKEFFNQPPQDAITLDNYYQTTDQVNASTNGLYNSVWYNYNNFSSWCISEMMGGNGRSYGSAVIAFQTFSETSDNVYVAGAWSSFYSVVAQANALINNLPVKVPSSVPAAVVNNALGEAHFMRGLAYFFLVRGWGNVPIIENSLNYVNDYQINTNTIPDIYKFIIDDFKFAEANCKTMIRSGTSVAQGHVSSGSASAFLSKVYLYQQDYANARAEAEKVINSGEFKLYGLDIAGKTFNQLFQTASNNNEESVAAIQWVAGGAYGHGNSLQAYFAINSTITGTGDGYSTLTPTIDLIKAFEPGDLRLHGTLMMPNDKYPEINQATGGFTVPAAVPGFTGAGIKKYVVGTPADNGGVGAAQATGNNTYLMRYAEVLLIEAEAVLGTAASTTDPAALGPFNKVRQRAGLTPLTVITKADIFHERRIELAIEGDYWYDLCRMDGYNVKTHPQAIAIIRNQERGVQGTSIKVPVTDAGFLLPYPTTELAANPKLLEPPVPYVFKK